MIKYDGYYITFQEVPDEISLVFTISNCKYHCKGCHSPWLRENIGKNLKDDFADIYERYKNLITCVCFMGDGNDIESLLYLEKITKCKTALYSGSENVEEWMLNFDYIKIGHYDENFGALKSKNTNQRMYLNENHHLLDITGKFQISRF